MTTVGTRRDTAGRAGDARLVMTQPEIDDDPAAWHALRRNTADGRWRLTASEMAPALGLAPDSWEDGSPFALYQAKLTGVSSFAGNDRTDLGLFLEDYISGKFANAHPELEVDGGGLYESVAHPWLAATFDRVCWEAEPHGEGEVPSGNLVPAGPAQLKSWAQRADFGDPGSPDMPLHIRIQSLTEMEVLGTDRVYVPVVFLPGGKVVTFVIERDAEAQADIDQILAGGLEFIGRLEYGDEPEIDWTPATTRALQRMYGDIDRAAECRVPVALARRRLNARAAKDAADKRLRLAENEIRRRVGNAGRVIARDPNTGQDEVVVTRSASPRAGYSVAPKERVETMRPGKWGKP